MSRQTDLHDDQTSQEEPSSYTAGSINRRMSKHLGKLARLIKGGFAVRPIFKARTFTVFASTTGSKVLSYDKHRVGILLQNLGSGNVYFGYDALPVNDGSGNFSNGHILPPGTSYETPAYASPSSDLYITSDAGDVRVAISETVLS